MMYEIIKTADNKSFVVVGLVEEEMRGPRIALIDSAHENQTDARQRIRKLELED